MQKTWEIRYIEDTTTADKNDDAGKKRSTKMTRGMTMDKPSFLKGFRHRQTHMFLNFPYFVRVDLAVPPICDLLLKGWKPYGFVPALVLFC